MPRTARLILPGVPHHVTHRGLKRQSIFSDSSDFQEYLVTLRRTVILGEIKILGYCLMPNHVHLIVIPQASDSLSRAIGFSHRLYSSNFNKRHQRSGKLFESRYYSTPLDERHMLEALIYVDQNPVRANIVYTPELYAWSSARLHLGTIREDGIIDFESWQSLSKTCDYSEVLKQVITETEIGDIQIRLGDR